MGTSEHDPPAAASRKRKRWTRRRVLAAGTGGALAVALPYRLLGYGDLRPYDGLTHLSGARGAILAEAIDALLPDAASRAPADGVERVRFLDGYVGGLSPDSAAQIGQLLYALEHLTLPLGGRLPRFSRLDAAGRRAYLEGWRTSGLALLRQAYRALVGLTFMSYYRTQAAFDSIGYPGPTARTVVAPLENLARYDALLAPAGRTPARER